MDTNFIKDFKFWKRLVNFWSIAFILFIIFDFINNNAYTEILGLFSIIYISILAIYVGNKEFERWYNIHRSQHPGEIFVVVWTILVFSLMFFGFILDKPYKLPEAVLSSYIAVLTILAITNKSKELYKRKKVKKK